MTGETLTRPECVHCGFCLPACPTYDVLGTEMDNPRGRLALMDALEAGRVDATEAVVRHLDLCLGCRACETACPSGVPYGEHLERARVRLHSSWERPVGRRLAERLLLRGMALPPAVQHLGWRVARLAQRSGVLGWLSGEREEDHGSQPARGMLAAAQRLLRAAPRRAPPLPTLTPADGRRRMRVGLLLGCVNRWMFGSINAATVRLLARVGCEVVIPPQQRCCGALHAHGGDAAGARRLARKNVAAFEEVGKLDRIVVNAAGCGSAMKAYGELLGEVRGWEARGAAFAERTRDVLELLEEIGPPAPRRQLRTRVAYHDACHLAHAQGLRDAPRRLLEQIPGLRLVHLQDADRCCGSAGIYNLLHPEVADVIGAQKLERLAASGAEVVAAGNPGCLLQLSAGARRLGLALEARHPVELLDEACS